TGTNGTVGLKAIKEQGGLVLVQDPQEAEYDGMPRSAIQSGQVDFILPVEQMPRMLLEFVRQPYVHEDAWRQMPDGFEQILALLRARQDCDFRNYKESTLVRRIQRRMNLHHIEQGRDYVDYLRAHGEELEALAEDLLISVTCFFRDPDAWAYLEQQVVPRLLARQGENKPLRLWVAGCATGEEVYSLGMVLLEQFQAAGRHPAFHIFASDLDQRALQVARAGLYPDSIEADVSASRLKRFFQQQDHHYRVSKVLRDTVVFAVHNLLNDPPFSDLDLITCRNLMIYLEPQAQRNILGRFHFALKAEGQLFLGTSETVGQESDLFEAVSKRWRVYRRIGQARPDWLTFGTPAFTRLQPMPPPVGLPASPLSPEGPLAHIQQQVLARHTAACVVLDQQCRIHHFYGPTHDYLVQPRGEATWDLMAWLEGGLRGKLNTLLSQTLASPQGRQPVSVTSLVSRGESVQEVVCTLEPLDMPVQSAPLWLLVFEDRPVPADRRADGEVAGGPQNNPQLENQLKRCQENLQTTEQQLNHVTEEYRSSHEEAVSVNEELQSTNEELETSKEELQSFNEELTTLNQQLQDKNRELERAYNDLNNLLASTEVATLFLDAQLCIRRFTPNLTRLMRLISTDIGRPIGDITTRFLDSDPLEEVREVLKTLIPQEAEVQTQDGTWYLRRTLPYRTEDDRIDGVVTTFVEINRLKQAETNLRKRTRQLSASEERFRALVEASADMVWTTDAQGQVVEDVPSWRAFTGQSLEQWQGGGWSKVVHPEDRESALNTWRQSLEHKSSVDMEFRLYHAPSGQWRWTSVRAVPLHDESGQVRGWVGMNRDITEHKQAELALHDHTRQLREQAEQLREQAKTLQEQDRRKDEFLGLLGHELRNPLAAIHSTLQWLRLGASSEAERQEGIDLIRRQEHHLLRLVDDLLNVSRINRGTIELHRRPLDLTESVREAVDLARTDLEARHHHLTLDLPETPLYLEADPERLVQILVNLLSNAARYTPAQGHITVTARREGQEAVIRVKDNGIGIAPDRLPRLFEAFSRQVAPNSSGRSGGLGLGLALAHQLAVLHEGRLEAFSKGEGQGSEFVVHLPALPEDWQPAEPIPVPEQTGNPNTPRRILLIEDDAEVAQALSLLLRTLGHKVEHLDRGEKALAGVRDFQPQVVLVDIGLPDIDGYEVARRLRQEYGPSLKLVALTGYGREQDLAQAGEMGFDHHLLKPAQVEDIQAILRDL
ncbi:MAG: CheR family methyltransferase, partial [Candidatus Competibacteraceae bacterium]|nr:CheR family methyltransferase [Candidatus Competibacteraceae bacterium]